MLGDMSLPIASIALQPASLDIVACTECLADEAPPVGKVLKTRPRSTRFGSDISDHFLAIKNLSNFANIDLSCLTPSIEW